MLFFLTFPLIVERDKIAFRRLSSAAIFSRELSDYSFVLNWFVSSFQYFLFFIIQFLSKYTKYWIKAWCEEEEKKSFLFIVCSYQNPKPELVLLPSFPSLPFSVMFFTLLHSIQSAQLLVAHPLLLPGVGKDDKDDYKGWINVYSYLGEGGGI